MQNLALLRAAGTAVGALLGGQIPEPLDTKQYNRAHLRQHAAAINQLIEFVRELQEYAGPLSRGDLNATPPQRANLVASPLKELQSQLKNLAWQVSRLAAGDHSQRFHVFGELSESLTALAEQMRQKDRAIAWLRDELAKVRSSGPWSCGQATATSNPVSSGRGNQAQLPVFCPSLGGAALMVTPADA